KIQYSEPTAGDRLVKVFELLDRLSSSGRASSPGISYRAPRILPTAIYSGFLALGMSLIILVGAISQPPHRAETPQAKISDQKSSVPLPPTRPMGGPFIENSTQKSTKAPRSDAPSPSIGPP